MIKIKGSQYFTLLCKTKQNQAQPVTRQVNIDQSQPKNKWQFFNEQTFIKTKII